MTRIYVATTNQGKLRDFAGVAAESGIEVAPLPGMAVLPAPVEDGETFEANARKKAEFYSRIVPGELVLADDSGLEVEALGGAPGVRSARYAALAQTTGSGEQGPAADDAPTKPGNSNSTDEANNRRLLRELEGVPDRERGARFVCVLAAARDGSTVLTARGEVQGMILREFRGSMGFGYDPLFYIPELGKTAAELSPMEKGRVSHRGRAFRKLLESIQLRLT